MSDQDDTNTEERNNKNDSLEETAPNYVSNFPAKLHFMLNELKRDGLEYIASWQSHGRCFIVRKPKEFESTILPCYFQQSKFASFQRQLSFYGYRRINYGRDKGCYFHEHFLRGNEELALMILRTRIKGTGPRKPNSMEAPVPNFYEMPFLHENTKNNINQDNDKKEHSLQQAAKQDNIHANEQTSQVATYFSQSNEDDNAPMIWKRNRHERLNQLQPLNELEVDPLLLSPTTLSTIQSYREAQASSQALISDLQHVLGNEIHRLQGTVLSSSSPSYMPFDNYPMSNSSLIFQSQSLRGLTNHPLTVALLSSSSIPSYNRISATSTLPVSIVGGGVTPMAATSSSDVTSLALSNNFQQRSSEKFLR